MIEKGFLAGLEISRNHGKWLPVVKGKPENVQTICAAWARYWFRVWQQTSLVRHPRRWFTAYIAYRRWFRMLILEEPLELKF